MPPSNHHHDAWSRLHGGSSGFPGGPSWAKGPDKRDERDRGKDGERRDMPHIKDEKDRDSLLYGRPPVRMSPVGPTFRPRSSTPVSHLNGHGGPMDDLTRGFGEKQRPPPPSSSSSSSRAPLAGAALLAERERPRSSSSSVLTTPPPSNRSAQSPLDLYPPRSQAHGFHGDHSHSSHSSHSSSQPKKSDRTATPVSKPPPMLLPPVKVKEERKEEPEHIPISLPPPPPPHPLAAAPPPPGSHPHPPGPPPGTPSSLSLTPTHSAPPHLSLLDRSRAIEAYLASAGAPGLVMGPGGERFSHGPPQPPPPPQGPHSYTWDPWRDLAAQQHQHRREALALRSDPHLALRSDPHLARLLQQQRLMEAERAAAVAAAAAAAAPQQPPTSTSGPGGVRPDFGLMAHHFERPAGLGPPGGGLMDEEQRAQILREDFERARYFGMHPHPHPHPHLPPGAHLCTRGCSPTTCPPGGGGPQHHAGLYSRLGHINPHHLPNGLLAKTTAGLVGALSVGAPPPLIPSMTSRSSTPPRGSRLGGGPGELALYSAHKDGESR
ncbi:unnamed protein product [Menidia menidia]|uniref:(Atlantic silverside) hypothetical protein n=1 Tax=Menidia menidia TaxID=238744 RepID=A0A8S4AZT5_9TELE|nr:unnamed protein product [Menidia menidia]